MLYGNSYFILKTKQDLVFVACNKTEQDYQNNLKSIELISYPNLKIIHFHYYSNLEISKGNIVHFDADTYLKELKDKKVKNLNKMDHMIIIFSSGDIKEINRFIQNHKDIDFIIEQIFLEHYL